MMQMPSEQLSATRTAGLAVATDLTWKIFEHVARLLKLNLEAMKATVAQVEDCATRASTMKDPQEFIALQMEWFQRAGDNMLTYRYRLCSTLAATRTEIDKAVEATPSNGAAASLAAWKDVFNATNTFYECLQSTMARATQVAESNFNESASKRMASLQNTNSILSA